MTDQIWITEAKKYLGLEEIPGPKHNSTILRWWEAIKADFRDDETPWCAAFVGGVLETVGIKSTRSAAARSYTKWGTKLDKPVPGCIVTFWRGSKSGWSGHVGFVVGKDQYGNLMVLGGNQGDEVNIKPFNTDRVLAYVWPSDYPLPEDTKLQVVNSNGRVSTNEA